MWASALALLSVTRRGFLWDQGGSKGLSGRGCGDQERRPAPVGDRRADSTTPPLRQPRCGAGRGGRLGSDSSKFPNHSCGSLQTCFSANEVSWRSRTLYTFSAPQRPFHLVLCFKCGLQILSLFIWEVRSAQSAHFAETRGGSGEASSAPGQKGVQRSPPEGYCQAVLDRGRSNWQEQWQGPLT